MEDSIQVPLLEPSSDVDKKVPEYFDTNIFDNYLFFWVNRFVSVINRLFFPYKFILVGE